MTKFVSPVPVNTTESGVALSPNGLEVRVIPNPYVDIPIYDVPAGAGYNTTTLPLTVMCGAGRQSFIYNNQTTALRVVGTAAGDDGVVVLSGTKQFIAMDGDGHAFAPGGPGASAVSVVLRPGEPNPEPNVYVTWEEAYDALNQGGRGVRFLHIEDELVSPVTIPPGNWDVEDMVISGDLRKVLLGSTVKLRALDGAKLIRLSYLTDGVELFASGNTQPVIESETGLGTVLVLREGAKITQGPGAPIISVQAGHAYGVVLDFGGELGDPAGVNNTVAVAAGAVFVAVLINTCILRPNAVAGPVGSQLQIQVVSPSAQIGTPQPVGSIGQQIQPVSTLISYTPGTIGDWGAPPPTTAQEAIDRIAAVLFANFGAIP